MIITYRSIYRDTSRYQSKHSLSNETYFAGTVKVSFNNILIFLYSSVIKIYLFESCEIRGISYIYISIYIYQYIGIFTIVYIYIYIYILTPLL